MPVADKELQLMVRREIARRQVDTTLLDVYAVHGVVHLRGVLRPLRGTDFDMKVEMGIIEHMLKLKPGVREVIVECSMAS